MIAKYCDHCGKDAFKEVRVSGIGGCGDSFCWASCDLRSCKGATYEWCGADECKAAMKIFSFVPRRYRKLQSEHGVPKAIEGPDLQSIIQDEKKKFQEATREELRNIKQTIATNIRDATTKQKFVVQFFRDIEKTDEGSIRKGDGKDYALIKKYEEEISAWLESHGVKLERISAGYNIIWSW